MQRLLALTAAAFLIAAPIAIAQTTQPEPPPTTQPTTPDTPAPTPTPTPPPTDPVTPPVAPTPPPSETTPVTPPNTSAPQGCRTRQPAGEQCACLSDTDRIGTSTAHPDGHNVCVRPD